jgi:hypothetical protein
MKPNSRRSLASKKTNSVSVSPTAELDLYLQEATVAIDSPNFDILTWWKVNSLRFPTLSTLVKQILMTPVTTITSESAFSSSGRVLSNFQSSLKPKTLEALVCTKDWISVKEGLYGKMKEVKIID